MNIEEKYVRGVYSEIADHFDNTRFCQWNFVKKFLEKQKEDMRGIDIGCGNGKNMLINENLNIIGIDNCKELVSICKKKNLNVFAGDCCDLKMENNYFDYAMSIAVFHHLGNEYRRHQALDQMIQVLKKGGCGIFSVWSIENQEKRRKFVKGANFVNWERRRDRQIFKRYYYIFTKDMIYKFLQPFQTKITIETIINERGNWVVVFYKK